MKYLLLAGTLAAIMLFAIVPFNNWASANVFLIDNFTADAIGMACDQVQLTGSSAFANQAGLGATVAGMVRECQIIIMTANPPDSGASTVVQADEMYRHMSGPGVSTMSFLQYDGNADSAVGPGNPRSLSLDLSSSDNLQIVYSFSDFDVNVTATMIDGAGNAWSEKKKLAAGTTSLKNLNFPVMKFMDGGVNLADVDEIHINFTNTVVATDYTLEKIHVTMMMVGGEMMPADTTALLLAGAELNVIWLLPAIAAIGIGAFVVSRKRK